MQSITPIPATRRRHRQRAVSLVVPLSIWRSARAAMLAARSSDGEEVIGLLFCERHRTTRLDRYLARHWVVPGPEDYQRQSTTGLQLKQAFHLHLLTGYLARGMHMVHLHTHPGAGYLPDFSGTDDRDEQAQSAAIAHLPGAPRLISGVLDEEMTQGRFRIWSGEAGTHRPVALRHDWMPEKDTTLDPSDPLFDRQRVFGAPAQQRLGALSVALVGCGGIGAPFAEQLSRLGVRHWTLVDDDRIDMTNLHRLPFATMDMARNDVPKIAYVAGLIRRFWGGAAMIETLDAPVEDACAQERIAAADLIVVATDNHASRRAAPQLALRTMRPLLCLGTHIEQRPGDAMPRIYSRATMPPMAGGWCLACGQVISLAKAAEELADPLTRASLAAGGYLPQVAAPAVYWVNTISAALGVRLAHGAIAGFIDCADGVDDLLDLATGSWLPISHDASASCFLCSPDRLTG